MRGCSVEDEEEKETADVIKLEACHPCPHLECLLLSNTYNGIVGLGSQHSPAYAHCFGQRLPSSAFLQLIALYTHTQPAQFRLTVYVAFAWWTWIVRALHRELRQGSSQLAVPVV